MEMLLCLPFLFVLFALVVDMGYGWLVKIETDTAARFVATTLARTKPGEDGDRAARRALEQYYGSLETRTLQLDDEVAADAFLELGGRDPGRGPTVALLFGWLEGLSSRRSVVLTAERRPPVGTLVTDSPVTTYFAIDSGTWTYEEAPLSVSGLVDQVSELASAEREGIGFLGRLFAAVAHFLGFVVRGFFWMLGMYP